jgi:hypothetical protein
MKNLKKFEKSEVQNLFSVKGGATIGGKTSTTTKRTVETTNDTDSNSDIEGTSSASAVLAPAP